MINMIDGQLNINQKEIIRALMSNDKLLRYLFYNDNSVDIVAQKNLTSDEKHKVREENIYEYRAVPDSNFNEVKTYVSMEYGQNVYSSDRRGSSNPFFIVPTFNFYLVTHRSLDSTKWNGSRINAIEDCIKETFHHQMVIPTLGITQLTISEPITINPNYIGRVINIRFVESSERNDKW